MENNTKFELNDEQLEQASGGAMTPEEFMERVKTRLYYRCRICRREICVWGDEKLSDFTCGCGRNDWECLGNL